MQSPDDTTRRLRFGVFEADLRTGELTKQGRRIRIQEQPFRLLAILLEKPGELVTREELRARLWPETTVDFDHGVNKAIGKIREALSDSAVSPRFVETVARRGYRFLAEVSEVRDDKPEPVADIVCETADVDLGEAKGSKPQAKAFTWRHAVIAAVFIFAGSLILVFVPWKHAKSRIGSLAVLPLQNLSNDPSQDYFTDGMTEELITELGQIKALRVISRTSVMAYKNSHKPLADIARTLNVDAVVEGSVLRSGERVRITAQLIEVPADKHVWAQSYEGDLREALSLQSRVARAIAEQVQTALLPQEQAALARSKAVIPEAYEAYLKGRHFWNKRTVEDLKSAIAYFNRSIQLDPMFVQAYSGLADTYALLGDWEYGAIPSQEAFAQAKSAGEKALALDDTLSEAHTSLAFVQDLYGWDWKAAEREHERAIELNPGYATAHQWYAWHLIVTGRVAEGIIELKQAQSLDPLSLIVSADLADALCVARRYDESVEQSKKTLEMDPNFAIGHFQMGQVLVQKNRFAEGVEEFKKAIDLAGHNPAFDSNLAHAYAVSGQQAAAKEIADDLRNRYARASSADANIAFVYVALGDMDEAMRLLERAHQARFNPSILLRPGWDRLRSDERFKALLGQIGLQDAGRGPM